MPGALIEVIQHPRWGKCVSLSDGQVELMATLDFGPRIIHLSTTKGKNLFFEDVDDTLYESGESFDPVGGDQWHIYGGHRLWTSPERIPRTTYPDNEPVEWAQVGERGIVLRPAVERWTQMAKEIEIQLSSDNGAITVTHRVTNKGAWPINFAPWALSVMSAGGRAVVPMTGSDNGLLPNRRFILWPYCRLNDPRIVFTETAVVVNQGEGPTPYKFGTDNEAGWAAYSNHGDTFIKHYRSIAGGTYPDFGVSFELYTSTRMLELETLGELQEVESGHSVEHIEMWQVVKGLDLRQGSEQDAVDQVKAYVK
ncbi:MAG: hypothetical protein P0Y55_12900 [Candidatus Cohnella colombiensis]|uniref:DUF4380 domain-containing protein n=1 Tax=Candidatus Cohnella colombiensis TaxID=3121368 RepID=A0AA95EUU4_9BACL|nr:MAG: hypothetical protein P0Y55_12900 [Cohnella sp.]